MASEPMAMSGPLALFAMWAAMMAAMMLPGAVPAVPWRSPAGALRFVAGYLAVWIAFALAAALAQLALESAHLLTDDMALRNGAAGGLILWGSATLFR